MNDSADKKIKDELDEISRKIDTIIEKIRQVDETKEEESTADPDWTAAFIRADAMDISQSRGERSRRKLFSYFFLDIHF